MNKALHEAAQKARARFLEYGEVVGVGYGPKLVGGKETTPEAIVVLVARKLPRSSVPKGQLIPKTFEGFPTDVREPRLSVGTERKKFDPEKPPEDPSDECLTDYEWIDWAKIHRLNLEQRRPKAARTGRGRATPEPGDEPADVPTTQVVGDVFVIKDPTGSLVTTVGMTTTYDFIGAYDLLRGTFDDDYDFVSFYIDVGSGMPDIGNASSTIFNATTGIGLAATNTRSSWGSTRLLRQIHHTWFSLRTLMHEPSHQWLFFVDYRDTAAGPTQDLLHQDWVWDAGQRQFHWGRWPDNDNSSLDYDRADWVAAGSGTFNRFHHDEGTPPDDVWFGFNTLDQYLMGLIPGSSVSSVTVVQNPSPAQSDAFTGPYTPSPGTVTVGLANVQYEEGTRSPDYLNSQRVFHHAVVVITKNTTVPSTFTNMSDSWRSAYTDRYRAATSGRLMVDTSLLRANHADVYLRDNAADTGAGPSTGTFWVSPDVWVRNADDNGTDHQCPIRGQANWIYVRVRNRGATSYANVTARVYLGNFATLTPGTEFIYPVDWNPSGLIGSATLASVPAASGGSDGTAIAKIVWPASAIPPAAGWHPCLLAEVIPLDTAPTGLHHVWENKKLAQRNLTIIDVAGGCPPMDEAGDARALMFVSKFTVGNALRPAQAVEVRLLAKRPAEELELFVDPAGLLEGLQLEGTPLRLPLPIEAGRELPDEETVRVIEPLPLGAALRESGLGAHVPPVGNTLFVPAGTQVALLADPEDTPSEETTWIRIDDDTRVTIGHRGSSSFAKVHRLKGMVPVSVNGLPLLRVVDRSDAAFTLRLGAGEMPTLSLIGIVSPFRRTGRSTVYDIVEESSGKVMGGLSLEVRT
jgi:hypothetical protein